jgi:anionic cell wall polymer biosynthesis LytR-Cps2A-Psr (LCP) family protein
MKGRTAILILLGILIMLGAVAGIIAIQLFYRQPFVPPSTLAAMGSLTPGVGTRIAPDSGLGTPARIFTATPDEGVTPIPPPAAPELFNTPGPPPTPGPLKEVCGATGSYIMLVIVTDVTSPDLDNDGAIGFRLIKVNFSGEKITIYGIPPELYLSASNLQPYGLAEATLAKAFDHVYSVERSNADATSRAANAVAQMLNENLGILASHYMVVDIAAVERYANSVGSLDIRVSQTLVNNEFDLQRGWHKMDGALIRKYITTRGIGGYAEWDRMYHQDDVLNAFRAISAQQEPVTFLRSVLSFAKEGFATDLNDNQLIEMTCLGNSIDPVRFRYYTLPQARVQPGEIEGLVINDPVSLQANIYNTIGSGE